MGSHKNYLDIGQQERDALNFVLDDTAVSVDVFRRGTQIGVAGLTAQTVAAEYLRTINVRLDSYRKRNPTVGNERVTDTPIGLTSDTDVRPYDLWRYTDVGNRTRWYRVASVSRTQSTSSAVLEEIKR